MLLRFSFFLGGGGVFAFFARILGVTLPEKQGKSQKEKSKEIQKSKEKKVDQGVHPPYHGPNCAQDFSLTSQKTARSLQANPVLTILTLVHRIAAFAFAFAMAIPRCQWRHRCVVTLGKFLAVLYSKPLWRKGKWKQRRKGDVRDVKHYHGRC